MTDLTTLPAKVQLELNRLARMTNVLVAVGILLIVGFGSFAIYEVRELQSHATELEQLTDDLCSTLQRAGILIGSPEENPCEQ